MFRHSLTKLIWVHDKLNLLSITKSHQGQTEADLKDLIMKPAIKAYLRPIKEQLKENKL